MHKTKGRTPAKTPDASVSAARNLVKQTFAGLHGLPVFTGTDYEGNYNETVRSLISNDTPTFNSTTADPNAYRFAQQH